MRDKRGVTTYFSQMVKLFNATGQISFHSKYATWFQAEFKCFCMYFLPLFRASRSKESDFAHDGPCKQVNVGDIQVRHDLMRVGKYWLS